MACWQEDMSLSPQTAIIAESTVQSSQTHETLLGSSPWKMTSRAKSVSATATMFSNNILRCSHILLKRHYGLKT